jgi:hypothetical protein
MLATRRYNPEDEQRNLHHGENLKSHNLIHYFYVEIIDHGQLADNFILLSETAEKQKSRTIQNTLPTNYMEFRVGLLLEKLTVTQPVKKLPAFYETRKFIGVHKSLTPAPILSNISLAHALTHYFLKINPIFI